MTVTAVSGNTYSVQIAFPSSASFGNAFLLNDPVQGVLDNVTYTLGGNVFADVTADVINISTMRGRNRELDQFGPGTATFTMRNNQRQYDVTNTSGTYYGGIKPRLPVQITVNNTLIFAGYVEDYDYAYDNPTRASGNIIAADNSTITVQCVDPFTLLGQNYLTAYNPTQELSGARVTDVLNKTAVDFPYNRAISTGSSTLGGGATYAVAEQTNALTYLQDVAVAEQGFLFCGGDGTLTFLGRNDVVSITSAMTFSDTGAANTTTYSEFAVQYGTELLFNRVATSTVGGAVTISTNAASIAQFLTIGLDYQNLLVSTEAQATGIGTFILGKYAQPEYRFASVTCYINDTLATTTAPLQLELADTVTVIKTWGTGTPSTVTQVCTVQGIENRITPDTHEIIVKLGTADSRAFLRLDNATFGLLDTGLLAF